ncbi:Nucleolar complex protein 2 [Dillenia turbinata]|uniref:Nucleolar complex protein 2 n=1 Tax=Dillenia turbinata TaxID=194707 RepID=A0AAN8ZD21_9MAGN
MAKLGKKARKFAKKNLQTVMKRKRKIKSMFKKKPKAKRDNAGGKVEDVATLSEGRIPEDDAVEETSLDSLFSDDDSDLEGDASDSDGYLSEDSSCPKVVESDHEVPSEENSVVSSLTLQNQEIHLEVSKKKKKLDKLKEKDPEFLKFLESYDQNPGVAGDEELYSDEDDKSNRTIQSISEDGSTSENGMTLTCSAVSSCCQLLKEQCSISALTVLLNAYRAACHHGTQSTDVVFGGSSWKIQNSETFSNIVIFMLQEADGTLRGLLGISSSNCRKEAILDLKNTLKWKTLKPLMKSYLRSTLFLLNQITDSEILAFVLTRLRSSIIFFAAFEPLLQRLIKIVVRLWPTSDGALLSSSFLVIWDVASIFGSDCFNSCFAKTYRAFIAHCKFVETVNLHHIQLLRDSLLKLCSLDMEKSSSNAVLCAQHLAKMLRQGLRTKKKEVLDKLCSWQYIYCIDLWVMFVSANILDHDLQPLLLLLIQVIIGEAHLFPGLRYLPLRLKCIHWLNQLSSRSGVFIPIASLVLESLEYKISDGGRTGEVFNVTSILKIPKHLLKSQKFHAECVSYAIELLSAHFAQWSYHISFPELATIPIINLKKFQEETSIESLRRVVKRLIDQVEQNINFVQEKRNGVAFSPKDHESAESFLQLEKNDNKTPFTQYYRSVLEKVDSRNLVMPRKISSSKQKNSNRHEGQIQKNGGGEGKRGSAKRKSQPLHDGGVNGEKDFRSIRAIQSLMWWQAGHRVGPSDKTAFA